MPLLFFRPTQTPAQNRPRSPGTPGSTLSPMQTSAAIHRGSAPVAMPRQGVTRPRRCGWCWRGRWQVRSAPLRGHRWSAIASAAWRAAVKVSSAACACPAWARAVARVVSASARSSLSAIASAAWRAAVKVSSAACACPAWARAVASSVSALARSEV